MSLIHSEHFLRIALFVSFLVILIAFLIWAERMHVRSRLAFRGITIRGPARTDGRDPRLWQLNAILLLELARGWKDLELGLSIGSSEEDQTAFDVNRSLSDDRWLITAYFLMFTTAALIAKNACGRAGQVIWPMAILLAVFAAIMDILENRAIRRSLGPWHLLSVEDGLVTASAKTEGDLLAGEIRRRSLCKWVALAILGLALGSVLFFESHTGPAALTASSVGCFVSLFGAYSASIVMSWWRIRKGS